MDPIHASIYGPDLWIRSVGPIRDGPVTGQRRASDELVTGWCMGRACGVGHQGFVIHLFEIHLFEFCTLCIYIYVYICLASCVSIIASDVVLLNDLEEIDNQHRWFFLLIYTSVTR